MELDGRSLGVGVSIGIAIAPFDGGDADQLFKRADIALFKAKAAGRGHWMFYEAGMEAELAERVLLAWRLRKVNAAIRVVADLQSHPLQYRRVLL